MDAVELWAAVALTAQGGDTEGLLGAAAREGLHLRRVEPLPGGFSARCAAGFAGFTNCPAIKLSGISLARASARSIAPCMPFAPSVSTISAP